MISFFFPMILQLLLKFWFRVSNTTTMEKLEEMFEIKTIPSCPARILQSYQADEIFGVYAAEKFQVKTKEKTFTTTMYPFLQTDYFVDELMGKAYHF